MLKKELERLVDDKTRLIMVLTTENNFLVDKVKFLEKYSRYNDDLSRALHESTTAVAHIVTDLKRRNP